MALNFNVLAQVPSVAERFMAGRQAAQEEQSRNMLLQQRAEQAQLERENALVTRQKTMADLEAARQRKAALGKVAEVFRREGKNLDLNTLNEAMSWALESGSADAVKQAEGLRNLFLQQQEDERIFGPQPSAAAPAAPAGAVAAPPVVAPVAAAAPAMEAAPVTAPMAAPAIDERGVNRAAWMAKAGLEEDVTPPAIPTPVNALAPTAAAPVNAMVAPEAAPGVQVAGPAALPAAAPKTFEYGGRTYTPQQIDMLLRSNRADRRDLGKAIVAANKPSDQKPVVVNGRLISPEGRVIYEPTPDTQPKPEKLQLGDRVAFVDMNPNSPTFRQEILSQQVGAAPEAPGAVASRAIQDRRVQLEADRLELERKRVAQQAERDAARDRRDAAAEARLERQLAQTDRRLAIAEEDARRAGDPAFQQRMANARVTGEAIAKGDVTAQRMLPQLISRAEEGVRLIDELIGRPEERDASGKVIRAATKPHPGFEDAVGVTWKPGFRFVPGTNAANFMARFDQIQGQSFLEAFETLKGGGAITEKEGTKGTEAINRARIAQSEAEFISAMRDLQSVVRKGVENAKRKASLGPAAPGGAPAAGVDTNNPLLK